MQERRRARFLALLRDKFKGDRAKFLAESGLTKGRLSQLENDGAFGERAARQLADRLGLRADYFDADVTPSLSACDGGGYELRLQLECYRGTECTDLRASGTNVFNLTVGGADSMK